MHALVAAIIVLFVATSGGASADDAETAALIHLERGISAFKAKELVRARAELTLAVELAPHKPNPYRWLALAQVQLGECRGAIANIDAFRARVAEDDPRLPELDRMRDLCARTGVLRITSKPPRVSLKIDNVAIGVTPYQAHAMRPGQHILRAEKPGFDSVSRSVVVVAGAELDLVMELPRAPTPLTRRPWFWATVVGATLVAGASTWYLVRDPGPALLPPIQCGAMGCQSGGS